MIIIESLTASYDGKTTLHFPDWQLEQGEECLMLGPSGSGKTTLLHILAGILRPKSGAVTIANENIYQLKSGELDKFRGRKIGLIFQKPHLIDSLTVKDNLSMAQFFAGLPQDGDRIAEVLADLGISDKLDKKAYTLSQGEAQRASIARALLNRPKVILADEPTSSLDDLNCDNVIQLLQGQAEKYRATMVISTHDQRLKERIPNHLILERSAVQI